MFSSKEFVKLLGFCVLLLALAAQTEPAVAETNARYAPTAQSFDIDSFRAVWHDSKRERDVPVKVYFPKPSGVFPVIVFSHGLGGSRDDYQYLGRCWASHGYVSVHVQHLGSDASVWMDSPVTNLMANLRKAAANPRNVLNRPADVSFAIDQLERLNREAGPLKGKLDLLHIGVAGHSFGAFTALAIAGQVFVVPGEKELSFADPRVKVAIAMSSPVPARKDTLDEAFGKIKIPILHMTGTEDFSPIGDTRPAERRVPFDHIHGAPQYLLTFNGGDHMLFSGRSTKLGVEKEKLYRELICESSVAFWDAYLKCEPAAKSWLTDDFKSELGKSGTFESHSLIAR